MGGGTRTHRVNNTVGKLSGISCRPIPSLSEDANNASKQTPEKHQGKQFTAAMYIHTAKPNKSQRGNHPTPPNVRPTIPLFPSDKNKTAHHEKNVRDLVKSKHNICTTQTVTPPPPALPIARRHQAFPSAFVDYREHSPVQRTLQQGDKRSIPPADVSASIAPIPFQCQPSPPPPGGNAQKRFPPTKSTPSTANSAFVHKQMIRPRPRCSSSSFASDALRSIPPQKKKKHTHHHLPLYSPPVDTRIPTHQ